MAMPVTLSASTSSAARPPASRGPLLSPLLPPPSDCPALLTASPNISDAENRLRRLIAEQTRLSPLEELARRSIVEGRQPTGKTGKTGSATMIDGLERLLRETGDLPSVDRLRDIDETDDDDDDVNAASEAQSASGPVTTNPQESPAGRPLRPLPGVPPSPITPVASDRSPSGSPWQAQHLLPPPTLLPPSATPSDDEPALPPSPDPQAGTGDDVNDLYSRPTERRTRLSTLGPKIRRDGPAPWELEGSDDNDGDLPPMADPRLLRPSRSSPEFKNEPDVGDDIGKGKRAWISSLGRRKAGAKDRESDDAGAAWKALGYAPPSPSVP